MIESYATIVFDGPGTAFNGPASEAKADSVPTSIDRRPPTDRIPVGGTSEGFSLLEILLAVAVLSIVLTAFYRLQTQTARIQGETRFQTEAPLLAREVLAQAENSSPEDLGDSSGDFGDRWPAYRWQIAVADGTAEALGETAGDLKRLEVTVDEPEGRRSYRLVTYRFMPE